MRRSAVVCEILDITSPTIRSIHAKTKCGHLCFMTITQTKKKKLKKDIAGGWGKGRGGGPAGWGKKGSEIVNKPASSSGSVLPSLKVGSNLPKTSFGLDIYCEMLLRLHHTLFCPIIHQILIQILKSDRNGRKPHT